LIKFLADRESRPEKRASPSPAARFINWRNNIGEIL